MGARLASDTIISFTILLGKSWSFSRTGANCCCTSPSRWSKNPVHKHFEPSTPAVIFVCGCKRNMGEVTHIATPYKNLPFEKWLRLLTTSWIKKFGFSFCLFSILRLSTARTHPNPQIQKRWSWPFWINASWFWNVFFQSLPFAVAKPWPKNVHSRFVLGNILSFCKTYK